ncbi:MAG: beta-N-acetylhexosaminidase [Bacteroidaceae bacterium]|nr:beta-N-acetylhexosaminidase [Bacteroidaceae bacterium]
MKRLLSLTMFLLLTIFASAQRASYDIIPMPKEVKVDTTQLFTLTSSMGIAFDQNNAECTRIAQFLKEWVKEATGIELQQTPANAKSPIRFSLIAPAKKSKRDKKPVALTEQQEESYTLKVDKDGILVTAYKPVGLFRAAQTLRKSLPVTKDAKKIEFPAVTITDQPRFVYRGVMLDCARHFFSVDFVKQYIDVMALHGCNQFHWHLTEDQGWRFEVKALPDLAVKGSVREKTVIGPSRMRIYDNIPYGGYYTQEECRDVVKYATERYVNIVPEIDMPGHMQSALHVFPNLGCTGGPYPVAPYWGVMRDVLCGGNPETLTFLKTVFGELCDVFPSPYIHIGGDECPKERWQKCPKCQAKIKELGLTTETVKVEGGDDRGSQDGRSAENKLQSYINHEIEQFLASRGRSLIGWDEILAGGLSEGAIVMSWRGTKGGVAAAKQKHRVIMSPNVFAYLDHPQLKDYGKQPRTTDSYIVSCSKIYSFEPLVPEELSDEEDDYILGYQGNLWTEQVAYPEHALYQLLPRLASMCEVQWCKPEQKDFEGWKKRLPQLKKLYDKMGLVYCNEVE